MIHFCGDWLVGTLLFILKKHPKYVMIHFISWLTGRRSKNLLGNQKMRQNHKRGSLLLPSSSRTSSISEDSKSSKGTYRSWSIPHSFIFHVLKSKLRSPKSKTSLVEVTSSVSTSTSNVHRFPGKTRSTLLLQAMEAFPPNVMVQKTDAVSQSPKLFSSS